MSPPPACRLSIMELRVKVMQNCAALVGGREKRKSWLHGLSKRVFQRSVRAAKTVRTLKGVSGKSAVWIFSARMNR